MCGLPATLPYLRRVACVVWPCILRSPLRGRWRGVRFAAVVASIRPESGHEPNKPKTLSTEIPHGSHRDASIFLAPRRLPRGPARLLGKPCLRQPRAGDRNAFRRDPLRGPCDAAVVSGFGDKTDDGIRGAERRAGPPHRARHAARRLGPRGDRCRRPRWVFGRARW